MRTATSTSLKEGLVIALRALAANKTRSLLTTLGIVIGVVTVTVMMMIIQGLNRSFANQISVLGSNTVYVDRWPWADNSGTWWKYINRPRITEENFAYVREHTKLASVVAAGTGTRRTISFRDNTFENIQIIGSTPEYVLVNAFTVETGRFLSDADVRSGRSVVAIGKDVQERLFGSVNPIGRRIRVGNLRYRVIGVLQRTGDLFGQSLDRRVVMPLSTFQNTFGRRRDVEIVAKAAEGVSEDDMVEEVRYLMRRTRNLLPREEDDFSLNRQEMLSTLYKRLTAGVYGAGLVIGGIALLVGGIGIMNIMLVSVSERTWEIGMRKAVGAKTSDILWQFLVEAMIICMFGGLVGLIFAWLAGAALKAALPVALPIWLAAVAVIFSGLIGLIFGLFPAAKAARLDPIVALRQE